MYIKNDTYSKTREYIDARPILNATYMVTTLVESYGDVSYNNKDLRHEIDSLMDILANRDDGDEDDSDRDEWPDTPFEWYVLTSSNLARDLKNRGELVIELLGLTLWGRCTTGQAVYLDSVMVSIAQPMVDLEVIRNHKDRSLFDHVNSELKTQGSAVRVVDDPISGYILYSTEPPIGFVAITDHYRQSRIVADIKEIIQEFNESREDAAEEE